MTDTTNTENRRLKGSHVFLITVSAFAIIIGVNFTMAFKAVSTFPGLEVKNSYVASQSFEARRAAQTALGWNVDASVSDGILSIAFTDAETKVVAPETVSVLLGRTTSSADDQRPELAFNDISFTAPVDTSKGLWTLRINATAGDGTTFEKRLTLSINE